MKKNFKKMNTKGAPLVEYVVLLGLIGIALIAITLTMGGQIRDLYDIAADEMETPRFESTTSTIVSTESTCDPQQYNTNVCTDFHEAVEVCDVESLAIGEACPNTILVFAGYLDGDRFYTYNPELLPALEPPNYQGDPELAWDSVDANSGNFYAFGYRGDARNHIDIIMHPRPHPAADYCESIGGYLPSPEQMDMMETNAALLGFPQSPGRIYQTNSQYWPGFGGFSPAPIGEPLNYAYLNTMNGSVGAQQHGFVTHEFFVRCITDLRNIFDDEDLWLDGTPNDDTAMQLAGHLGGRGFEANDTITGTIRQEIFIGGPGNDNMRGGRGNDIYIFEAGFGQDIVNDSINGYNGGGTDTLQFQGMNSTDFTMLPSSGSNRDIVFTHTNGDSVIVYGMRYVDSDYLVETLTFDDIGTLNGIDMRSLVLKSQQSTGTVLGFYQNDRYEYSAGENGFTLFEYGGNDEIVFSDTASTDWTFNNTGRDLVLTHTASGEVITIDDQFYVSSSDYVETLTFTDTSYDRTGMANRATADAIAAGGTVNGSYGNDTYIVESTFSGFSILEQGGTDAAIFPDSASTDWTFINSGRNLVATYIPTGETLTVIDQYYVSSSRYIESFQFTDQTLNRSDAMDKANTDALAVGGNVYAPYNNNDTYVLTSSFNSFTLYEYNGTDTIHFTDTASTDWRFINTGRDLLATYLVNGRTFTIDDQFYVSSNDRVENFQFTDTTLNYQGSRDKAVSDALALGGTIYAPYSSNDTYNVPASFTSFTLYEQNGGTDTFVFSDTASTDWTFRNTGRDLIATHDASGKTFTVDDAFYVSSGDYVENFQFTDTTLNRQGSITKAYEDQSSAGNTVYAAYNNNDTYTINSGFTSFTLREQSGTDAIVFFGPESDWAFSSVGSGRDLLMTHTPSGRTILLDDHLYVSSSRYIESFQFTDVTLDRAGSIAKIP